MLDMLNITRLDRSGTMSLSERRLHNRAKAVWQAMRRGHEFPKLAAFDLCRMNEISEHGFLLELRENETPRVVYAGEILCAEAMLDTIPVSLAVISNKSLLSQFGSRWMDVVHSREPMTSEYEFTTDEGYKVSCRGILLPLATDGENIDHIYGVVNWKSKKLGNGSSTTLPASVGQQGALEP